MLDRVAAASNEENAAITDEPLPTVRLSWVLVAPAVALEDEQGRPDLYRNGGEEEWAESPDEASEFSDAGRAAFDLSAFEGDVAWRERQAT